MPNLCCNTITITGTFSELAEIYGSLDTSNGEGDVVEFSLHQTIPARYYNIIERNELWGTKYDVEETLILVKESSKLVISCNSKWTPPLEWAKHLVDRFPELSISIAYCESGVGIYGFARVTKTCFCHEEYKITSDDLVFDVNLEEYFPCGNLMKFIFEHNVRDIGG